MPFVKKDAPPGDAPPVEDVLVAYETLNSAAAKLFPIGGVLRMPFVKKDALPEDAHFGGRCPRVA